MKTSPVAVALALLAALVLGTAFASPALAHDRLKSSNPAKGAKVETLEEVKLTFSATVRFPNVVVRSGDETHQDGKPAVDGSVVTQKVKGDLPPGAYVIAYRVVSSDGHPIEGEIPFTLLGSTEPSPSPSPPPSETSPSPGSTESPGSDREYGRRERPRREHAGRHAQPGRRGRGSPRSPAPREACPAGCGSSSAA